MSTLIRHKGIFHERFDAPFIGALISSIKCSLNCPDCFHDSIKDGQYIEQDVRDIIGEVMQNPLNDGIILGGLEWSEQPEEMALLINEAIQSNLYVILFTGKTEKRFTEEFPEIAKLPIWIKFGRYDKTLEPKIDPTGVHLASSNQYIKLMGE